MDKNAPSILEQLMRMFRLMQQQQDQGALDKYDRTIPKGQKTWDDNVDSNMDMGNEFNRTRKKVRLLEYIMRHGGST